MSSKDVQIVFTAQDKASGGIKNITGTIKGLNGELETMAKSMLYGGVAASGVFGKITGAVSSIVGSAKEWGMAVDDIVDQTGASGEEASKLLVIAKRTGIGMEESAAMWAKFGKAISLAKDEMTKAANKGEQSDDIFSRLGMSIEDIGKQNIYEVFQQIADKMRNMADGADKDRIAMELFGRSGYRMHDMLSMSREEMEKLTKKAQEMGLVISSDTAQAWEEYDRNMKSVTGTVDKIAISIGNQLLPTMQKKLEAIKDITDATVIWTEKNKELIGSVVDVGTEIAKMAGVAYVLYKTYGVIAPTAIELGAAISLVASEGVIAARALTGMGGAAGIVGAICSAISVPVLAAAGAVLSLFLIVKQLADWAEEKQKNAGANWNMGWVTELGWVDTGIPKDKSRDNADIAASGIDFQRTPTKLAPTNAGAGSLDTLRDKLANMIDDFNAKIMAEVGTTFAGNAAKLSYEIAKATRELDEMAKKGLDTSEARKKLEEYNKVMTEKYTRDQLESLGTLKADTMKINADIVGDKIKAAEAEYQAALISIEKERRDRFKAAGDKVKADEWANAKIREAEEKKRITQANARLRAYDILAEENRLRIEVEGKTNEQLRMITRQLAESKIVEIQKQLDTELKLETQNAERILELRRQLAEAQKTVQNTPITMNEALNRGFRDALDGFGYWADNMRQFALDTATGMRDAFSDFFFDAMMGKLKSLGDYFNSFLQGIARSMSQLLANRVASQLIGGMLGGVGGGIGFGGVSSIATAGAVVSGAGGWDVPNISGDIPMFVHKREMVLPANLADNIRNMSGSNSRGTGDVTVILNNNTGNQMQAKAETSFDGARTVITLFLEGYSRNIGGIQSMMPMGAR